MSNKNHYQSWCDRELLFYALFSALAVGIVLYLFYYDPVNFAFFVTEDHFAEYGTSVSFGLAGIILVTLSIITGSNINKTVWIVIGIVALLVAAEEVSWGQRILNIEIPTALREQNLQNELNIHNLPVFQSYNQKLLHYASYLILSYLFISLAVPVLKPYLAKMFTNIGIPLIPIRLFPVFLLTPYFIIFTPVEKNGELGELFLGIALLLWAADLSTLFVERKKFGSLTPVLTSMGILLLAGIITAGLTYKYSADATNRLNLMASRDYHKREMYSQAQAIYAYIYHHPRYLTNDTRIHHAKMLQITGNEAKATQILLIGATHLEEKVLQKGPSKLRFRRLGLIYMMLGESNLADYYFDKAIENDQRKLALSPAPDEKAKLLLSLSKTMQARGDISSAINNIEQAVQYVQSAALRFQLERRLRKLTKLQAGSLQMQ